MVRSSINDVSFREHATASSYSSSGEEEEDRRGRARAGSEPRMKHTCTHVTEVPARGTLRRTALTPTCSNYLL